MSFKSSRQGGLVAATKGFDIFKQLAVGDPSQLLKVAHLRDAAAHEVRRVDAALVRRRAPRDHEGCVPAAAGKGDRCQRVF